MLKKNPGMSRAEIADETGLTRASITKITKQLLDQKILIEKGNNENTGGRPSIMLYLNENAGYFIGVYMAPRRIYSIYTSYTGEVVSEMESKITEVTTESILELLDTHITMYKKINANILGIGIALNGMVNSTKGISIFSPHYKWKNFDLKSYLKGKYNCPISIENDVRLMALGELEYGGARGEDNFVLVNISDGVGSGIIIDKKIYKGNNYCAGEIGHVKVSDNKSLMCSCGKTGCLETVISDENVILLAQKEYGLEIETLQELSELYNEGNINAQNLVEHICKKLSFSLSSIINLLNPHTILINGKINKLGKNLYKLIEDDIKENSLEDSLSKLKVKPSKLGDIAAAKGAISLLFENIYK